MASKKKLNTLHSIKQLETDGKDTLALQTLTNLCQKQGYSKQKLLLLIKLQDKLSMTPETLKSCDLLLFYDPMSKEAHQTKLKLLKRQRKF